MCNINFTITFIRSLFIVWITFLVLLAQLVNLEESLDSLEVHIVDLLLFLQGPRPKYIGSNIQLCLIDSRNSKSL